MGLREYLLTTAKNEGLQAGMEKGIQAGMEKGRIEGMLEKAIDTARKMLSKGYNKQEISEILGLSIKELEKL